VGDDPPYADRLFRFSSRREAQFRDLSERVSIPLRLSDLSPRR